MGCKFLTIQRMSFVILSSKSPFGKFPNMLNHLMHIGGEKDGEQKRWYYCEFAFSSLN